MAEVKLRFNISTESVELVVDNEVALESGPEVFVNWVKAYNDKHKSVEEPVEEKVVTPQGPVEQEEKTEDVKETV